MDANVKVIEAFKHRHVAVKALSKAEADLEVSRTAALDAIRELARVLLAVYGGGPVLYDGFLYWVNPEDKTLKSEKSNIRVLVDKEGGDK